MPYRGNKYEYTIPEIRAIEEAVLTYGLEAVSNNEIYFQDRKGREWFVTNPYGIAEYIADFLRGCKFIGKKSKSRMGYKQIERIVAFLNGGTLLI